MFKSFVLEICSDALENFVSRTPVVANSMSVSEQTNKNNTGRQ